MQVLVLLPKRCGGAHFGWLNWCRRLNKDYELLLKRQKPSSLPCSHYGEAIGSIRFHLLTTFQTSLLDYEGIDAAPRAFNR